MISMQPIFYESPAIPVIDRMLRMEQIKDGYAMLHGRHGGQIVVIKNGDKFISANLDGIDPQNFREEVHIDLSGFHAAENISEDRFHFLRENANARAHITKITAAVQLQQAVQQGKAIGMIEDTPVVATKPQEAPKKAARVVPGPGNGPAPIAPPDYENPGAPLSSPENDDGYKDGAIVEVPSPSQR